MRTTVDYEMPEDDWSLERLGELCQRLDHKMAIHAWIIGRAMAFAKAKATRIEFVEWRKKYGISASTESRYCRLFKLHKSPEELGEKGLTEALLDAGILKQEWSKKDKKSSELRGVPSWAVGDANDWQPPRGADGEGRTIVLPSPEVALAEEVKVLPQQLQSVCRKIEWILGEHDDQMRLAAWPEDRTALRQNVAQAMERLAALDAELVGKPVVNGGDSKSEGRQEDKQGTAA